LVTNQHQELEFSIKKTTDDTMTKVKGSMYKFSPIEFSQMTDEERAKIQQQYIPPKETVLRLLHELLETQSQILHVLEEIKTELYFKDNKEK